MNGDLLQPGWRERGVPVNGLNLHVVDAGREGDPLLILLHGFPEFWWAWRLQIAPLVEAGFHVVVPDMRGYNLSDAPEALSAYRLHILADDVAALGAAFGADRFDLVGHDWGGVVAWAVAGRHAERLRRLVIMDAPNPDVWGGQALEHPTQMLRSAYVGFFQAPWLPEATLAALDFAGMKTMLARSAHDGAFSDDDLERYAEAWSRPGVLTAMLNYYRTLRERPRPETPVRIRTPTLILWGEKDAFLEHHVARAALDLCDDGRLTIVEGATHWLHLEQPDRIAAEIAAFLARP